MKDGFLRTRESGLQAHPPNFSYHLTLALDGPIRYRSHMSTANFQQLSLSRLKTRIPVPRQFSGRPSVDNLNLAVLPPVLPIFTRKGRLSAVRLRLSSCQIAA